MTRRVVTWVTWDEPDRDVAVAEWKERGIRVVFPLPWAKRHGRGEMLEQAKHRIQRIEGTAGRTLVPGSVLLAFSRHTDQPQERMINPDVSRGILMRRV